MRIPYNSKYAIEEITNLEILENIASKSKNFSHRKYAIEKIANLEIQQKKAVGDNNAE
jgi:hypothetical protein